MEEEEEEKLIRGVNPNATRLEVRKAREVFDECLKTHDDFELRIRAIHKVFEDKMDTHGIFGGEFIRLENQAITFNYCRDWINESLNYSYDHSVREKERKKERDSIKVGLTKIEGEEVLKKIKIEGAIKYVSTYILDMAVFLSDVFVLVEKNRF